MPVLDKDKVLPVIRAGLEERGMRGVVATGWSERPADVAAETLFVVEEVDHQSLLPRCAAAVHHGGAGTTAVSAAAGIPTIVCSVLADQRFWGARCRALGIGDTFPLRELDAQRLTASLRAVGDSRIVARAEEIGRRIGKEDGVGHAVAFLKRVWRRRAGGSASEREIPVPDRADGKGR